MILTAPPPDNWKRPPGRSRITWLNTVQRDLTLNEAVDLAQNRPLWDADVYVWRYALLVMHAGKEEDFDYRYSLNWFRLTGNRDSARLIRNQEPRCSSLRITTDSQSASERVIS